MERASLELERREPNFPSDLEGRYCTGTLEEVERGKEDLRKWKDRLAEAQSALEKPSEEEQAITDKLTAKLNQWETSSLPVPLWKISTPGGDDSERGKLQAIITLSEREVETKEKKLESLEAELRGIRSDQMEAQEKKRSLMEKPTSIPRALTEEIQKSSETNHVVTTPPVTQKRHNESSEKEGEDDRFSTGGVDESSPTDQVPEETTLTGDAAGREGEQVNTDLVQVSEHIRDLEKQYTQTQSQIQEAQKELRECLIVVIRQIRWAGKQDRQKLVEELTQKVVEKENILRQAQQAHSDAKENLKRILNNRRLAFLVGVGIITLFFAVFMAPRSTVLISSSSMNHLEWLVTADPATRAHTWMLTPSRTHQSFWQSAGYKILGYRHLVLVHSGSISRNPFGTNAEQGYAQMSSHFDSTNVILYHTPCDSISELVPGLDSCQGQRHRAFEEFVEALSSDLNEGTRFWDIYDHSRYADISMALPSSTFLRLDFPVVFMLVWIGLTWFASRRYWLGLLVAMMYGLTLMLLIYSLTITPPAGNPEVTDVVPGPVQLKSFHAPGAVVQVLVATSDDLQCSQPADLDGQVGVSYLSLPSIFGKETMNALYPMAKKAARTPDKHVVILADERHHELIDLFRDSYSSPDAIQPLFKEIGYDIDRSSDLCGDRAFQSFLVQMASIPPRRFKEVMGLEETGNSTTKKKKEMLVAAIGLEGAGKSTTLRSLAIHAGVNQGFDAGDAGVSYTQRILSAPVGQFRLLDTKGLPDISSPYVPRVHRFLQGYASLGEELIWEDLDQGWFNQLQSPTSDPVDHFFIVLRYTTFLKQIREYRSFLTELRRSVTVVVAVTFLPSLENAKDYCHDIGAKSRCVGLPLWDGIVSPHALVDLMQAVLDAHDFDSSQEKPGDPLQKFTWPIIVGCVGFCAFAVVFYLNKHQVLRRVRA